MANNTPERPELEPDEFCHEQEPDFTTYPLCKWCNEPQRADEMRDYCWRRELHQANERIRTLEAEREWRPIETAPKDGTEFTGGWANRKWGPTGTPMCWQKGRTREGWFMLSPTYENDKGEFFPGKWINERESPTHWMPLIKAPKAARKGATEE